VKALFNNEQTGLYARPSINRSSGLFCCLMFVMLLPKVIQLKKRTGNTTNFNEIRGLYCYFIYDHSFSNGHFSETVVHLMFENQTFNIFYCGNMLWLLLFLLLNILPTIFYQ
jgi:hypothetical protein